MKQLVTSDMLRRRARTALKRDLPTISMVYFLSILPTMLTSLFASVQQLPLTQMLNNYSTKLMTNESFSLAVMLSDLEAATSSPLLMVSQALQLLAQLFSPVLAIGAYAALLNMLRGGSVQIKDVLCRIRLFLRSLGLTLHIALKVLLWTLPGIAVMIALAFLMRAFPSDFLYLLFVAVSFLSVVPGLRAALHYSQSFLILADEPHRKIRETVRESVSLMRYRKMLYVLLYLSFIGWSLLLSIAQMLTAGMGVVSYAVQLAGMIALGLYQSATFAAFYDTIKGRPSKRREPLFIEVERPQGNAPGDQDSVDDNDLLD